jgi:hypothetical protein
MPTLLRGDNRRGGKQLSTAPATRCSRLGRTASAAREAALQDRRDSPHGFHLVKDGAACPTHRRGAHLSA